jgi:uracil-DNA glycosylase family 4
VTAVPLLRGSAEGANCDACPFSSHGLPTKPVFSEFPEDPLWIVIGEGPGYNEVAKGRPFIGASGQVVNKILHKIGRPREQLFVGNATLCLPPQGSPVEERERAAACCKPRLVSELQRFPGKPILTLGAVAARAVIPKNVLDAIDPPDVPKSRKKSQKEKQKAARKDETKRGRAVEKIAKRRFAALMKVRRDQLKREVIRRYQRKPDRTYLDRETQRDVKPLWAKAWKEAHAEYEAKKTERALAKQAKAQKPKKKKPIKITDIVGTLFEVDVDGSGKRCVIPAIHPAALLHGGGATISGSHTPDMAYVNIVYDAGKADALARGKDVRLKIDVDYEVQNAERVAQLFLEIVGQILDAGEGSLDLETYVDDPDRHHALMAYVAKIRVIGLATKIDGRFHAVSLAWDLLPDWALSYLQLLLARVPIHYHHGLYDRTVLRAYGYVLPIVGIDGAAPEWHDSLFAHHASFPGNSHNLQSVTAQFFGVTPWKAQFRNQDETADKLAIYNAKDTGSTHANVHALQIWVKRTQTEKIYAIDRHMADIASRMHLHGIPVSREVNAQLLHTFTRNAIEARRVVNDKANDPAIREAIKHHLALQLAQKKRKADPSDFEERYHVRLDDIKRPDWRWNANNGKHIAALLQAMGVPLLQTTEGGSISTKKDVLETLIDKAPIVRDILLVRENEKMLDFVEPIFDREFDGKTRYGFADDNDRIHPIWSIHKISGRWAASEPFGISNAPREHPSKETAPESLPPGAIVLEQICKCGKAAGKDHKEADHEFELRGYIYAKRPTTKRQVVAPKGRKLVGFDFEQLEARILALISGDAFMCDVFGRNGDLHTECAIDVFPGFLQKSPKERKMARTVCKTLEYATWYGASDDKVWKGLLKEGYNFKFADVVGSLNILRRKMSGIVTWQRETIQKAMHPPFELRDFVLGRRRVWPMGQVEPSEALNIVPQSTGAAVMDLGMAKMDKRIIDRGYKEAFPFAQIHDAAVYECWENDAEKLAADVKDCFTFETSNPINGKTITFTVDVGIGDAWFEV